MPDDMASLLALMRNREERRGRVMGVDPGDARVGLAVSDEGRTLARPLETVRAESDRAAAEAIAAQARELAVDTIVVGHPVRMNGTLGPRAGRARELAVRIEDAARVRVVLWDERLSSVEAERMMRERGERAKGRKGRVDALAASVILQGYLDAGAPDRATGAP
jgi:putative Holliday junction resolvase